MKLTIVLLLILVPILCTWCALGLGSASGEPIVESDVQKFKAEITSWNEVELKEAIGEDLSSGEALKIWIENPDVTAIRVHFNEINTEPEWGAIQILNEPGSIIWEASGYLINDIASDWA